MSSLELVTPAPLIETVALYARNGLIRPLHLKAAIFQHHKSETMGFRVTDGRLVAAAGFYPVSETASTLDVELWFACAPEIKKHLFALRRAAALTGKRLRYASGLSITVRVAEGHRPGRVLAAMAGFHFVGLEAGDECWRWKQEGLGG